MSGVAPAAPRFRSRLLTTGRKRLNRLRSDRQPLAFRVTLWLSWLSVAAMACAVLLMPTRLASTSWGAAVGVSTAMAAVLLGHSGVCGVLCLVPGRRATAGRFLASLPLLLPASLMAYSATQIAGGVLLLLGLASIWWPAWPGRWMEERDTLPKVAAAATLATGTFWLVALASVLLVRRPSTNGEGTPVAHPGLPLFLVGLAEIAVVTFALAVSRDAVELGKARGERALTRLRRPRPAVLLCIAVAMVFYDGYRLIRQPGLFPDEQLWQGHRAVSWLYASALCVVILWAALRRPEASAAADSAVVLALVAAMAALYSVLEFADSVLLWAWLFVSPNDSTWLEVNRQVGSNGALGTLWGPGLAIVAVGLLVWLLQRWRSGKPSQGQMVGVISLLLLGPAIVVQAAGDIWSVGSLITSPPQIGLLLSFAVLALLLLRFAPHERGRFWARSLNGRLLAALLILPFAAIHAFAVVPTAVANPVVTKAAALLVVLITVLTFPPVAADRIRNARDLLGRVVVLSWTFAAVTFMAVAQSAAGGKEDAVGELLDLYGVLASSFVSIPLAVSLILVVAARQAHSRV